MPQTPPSPRPAPAQPQSGTPSDLLGGLNGGTPAMPQQQDSGLLSDQALEGMVDQDPEAQDAQDMMSMLEDENVPPEVKDLVQSQIAIAARRRLASL